ncbi:hypothetical protein [Aureimonas sp. SK2]|uniref:hypothetical protein n=1 Tax=Aureimonas sp. SK2 TaxID=3015992 RepID=UPI0024451126|nr:hypothetical protein [Aureimonas sp. SK2]
MPRNGTYHLAEIKADKVCIACDCGLSRRYDRLELLERAGDRSMPALLLELARRNGCKSTEWPLTNDRCRVYYGTPGRRVDASFFSG